MRAPRRSTRGPVIAVGRIKDPVMADRLIAEGRADLVSMGRAHIADPELAAKAAQGRLKEIRPCIGCCRGCIESVLALEEGIPIATMARLAEMGHRVRPVSGRGRGVFGDGQIIRRDAETGVLFGGSDPRKDGLVAAF